MSTTDLQSVTFCSLTTNDIPGLAAAIGAPLILGYLASCHVRKFKDLYNRDVIKPRFQPARFLFAPVWAALYLSIGYASYIIYKTGEVQNVSMARPLAFYCLQLALNLCWPALFFRYRNSKVALYIITSNLVTALVTAYKFYCINEVAGKTLIPYLAWLAVSGYVNKVTWRLNQNNKKLTKAKLFTYPSNFEAAKASLDLVCQAQPERKFD